MITVRPSTTADEDAIAAIWNAKTLDNQSCWFQAATVEAADIESFIGKGLVFYVAENGGGVIGFGYWLALAVPRLVALAADDEQAYYHLMLAYCQWATAFGAIDGTALLGVSATSEKARMDALGVISYTTIGYEPLAPGQDPATRVPKLLRADCDLAALAAAIEVQLAG